MGAFIFVECATHVNFPFYYYTRPSFPFPFIYIRPSFPFYLFFILFIVSESLKMSTGKATKSRKKSYKQKTTGREKMSGEGMNRSL